MAIIKRNFSIENARIAFRNFSGKEGRFNPKGRRNFCVLLEQDIAKELENDGWNIRYLQPRDPDDEPQPYLQVTVNYSNFPPKITAITSTSKTILEEETVNILDWAEYESIDLIIRPYNWEVNGKVGVKAYLKTMYITLIEDEFEAKYKNVPDSAAVILDDDEPPWKE